MNDLERFKTISIDFPWPERGGGKSKRGADRHYKTIHPRHAVEVIQGSGVFRPADTCHLFFWTTNNYLAHAVRIIEELDFEYKTIVSWVKPYFGLGQYFRGQTEHMLFAIRGKGLAMRREWNRGVTLPTVIHAPRPTYASGPNKGRSIHSAKPPEAIRLIEQSSPRPRLEMFAREARDGWTVWGDEVEDARVRA